MLQTAKMVDVARKAVESLYCDCCTVIEYQAYTKSNMSTDQREVTVIESLPCKLSYSSIKSNVEGENNEAILQTIKLFVAPEANIKPGSKFIVTHKGRKIEYKNSGIPAVYATHQEIMLELFDRWA